MALSSLSQLELLFHAGMDENALGNEIDAWIEDVQKHLIKITEVEAILRRYYQHFVIAVEEKDRNEKSISELKEEITECECDEKESDNADLALKKNIQDLETIQQDFFNKIEYARAELHNIIKILLKGSITKREQESPKRVLDETLGMSDNTKKNRVSFSPKSKSSSSRNNRRRHVSSTK